MSGSLVVLIYIFAKLAFAGLIAAIMGAFRYSRKATVITALVLFETAPIASVIVAAFSNKLQQPVSETLALVFIAALSAAGTAGVALAFHWLGGWLRTALSKPGASPLDG